MTNVCKLHFTITVNVQEELADELGEDIAHDLLCEFYNGEDVIEVKYIDYDVVC